MRDRHGRANDATSERLQLADYREGLIQYGEEREGGGVSVVAIDRSVCVCARCGAVGRPVLRKNRSVWMLAAMTMFGVLPGVLYYISTNTPVEECANCHAAGAMISLASPTGAMLARQSALASASPRRERMCPFCSEMVLMKAKVCRHCGRDIV